MWLDTHCHLDAPEFASHLGEVIEAAAKNQVQGILLPAVKASDAPNIRALVAQHFQTIPGLVYTLGIHPLYVEQSTQADLDLLATEVKDALHDPRFVGIGEIGLDYFVEGLDRTRQAYFFEQQGRVISLEELHQVIEWLTGFDQKEWEGLIAEKATFATFFDRARPVPFGSTSESRDRV